MAPATIARVYFFFPYTNPESQMLIQQVKLSRDYQQAHQLNSTVQKHSLKEMKFLILWSFSVTFISTAFTWNSNERKYVKEVEDEPLADLYPQFYRGGGGGGLQVFLPF